MTRLPDIIDFDEAGFPELSGIFRGIDAGIAAIVASDPTLRPKSAHKRRSRPAKSAAAKSGANRRRHQRAA